MINQPLVSVFIPYYNDEKYLKEAIESIINQTYENWELILLNHASTDGSRAIAHSYNDKRIKHIDMDKNYGAGGGILFEKFLKAAKGKYLKPMCADDILLSNCLEILTDYMENHNQISFAYGDVNYIDDESNLIGDVLFEYCGFNMKNSNIDELKLYKKGKGHTPWPAVIFRAADLKDINIDKILIMEFDMSVYLELLVRGYQVGFTDKKVTLYRLHSSQMSRDKKDHSISNINNFEIPYFLNIFYKMKSVSMVKQVFDDSPFAKLLTEKDEKFIPFVIAHYFSTNKNSLSKQSGYNKMAEILNNDNLRLEIERKFNYTVRDFRECYKSKPVIKVIENKKIVKEAQERSFALKEIKYKLSDIKIFIPTFNRPEFLRESIRSLVCQTAGCPDITVYNNGTLKETSDVINEFKVFGVKEVKSKGGLLECMDSVLNHINTPYVMFFHDDDILNSKYLEYALEALNTYDNIAFITTRLLNFNSEETINKAPATEDHFLFTSQEDFANYMYLYESIAMQTAIYKTNLLKQYPRRFDEYGKFFDWPYLVQLSGFGNVVLMNCRRMFNVRRHKSQWSNDKNSYWQEQHLINWHKQFAEAMHYNDINSAGHKIFSIKFEKLISAQYTCFCSNNNDDLEQKQKMLKNAINQIGINEKDEFYNVDLSYADEIKTNIQNKLKLYF